MPPEARPCRDGYVARWHGLWGPPGPLDPLQTLLLVLAWQRPCSMIHPNPSEPEEYEADASFPTAVWL